MTKTGQQIEEDVYGLLAGSDLAGMLSGDVYRGGCRPRDSVKEDAVVIFTTGLADEVAEGVVTLNIFVPDIDPWGNGVYCPDLSRLGEIEAAAQQWVKGLHYGGSNSYLLTLKDAVHTQAAEDIRQHFVVVKLAYRHYGGALR